MHIVLPETIQGQSLTNIRGRRPFTSRHVTQLLTLDHRPLERQRTTAEQMMLFSQITTAGTIFEPFLTISFEFHPSFENTNL